MAISHGPAALLALLPCMVFAAEPLPTPDCASSPEGTIRIQVSSNTKTWTYVLAKQALSLEAKNSESRQLPKTGAHRFDHYWGSEMVTLGHGFLGANTYLDDPYAVSPDGRYAAVAVYRDDFSYPPTRKVAVIALQERNVLARFETSNHVQAIAWSPSSSTFAVIDDHEEYGKTGLFNRFAAAMGHPIPYDSLAITLFGADGHPLCHSLIRSDVPYGDAVVEWVQ